MMGCSGVLQRWVHPPLLPFADFCHAVKAGFPSFSRCRFRVGDTGQISRGKTRILPRIDAGFTKCIPAGGCPVCADGGLRGHVPAGPRCITPHIRFLFVAPRFRLGLPPHPASRRRTCPLANLRLCMNLVSGLAPDWIRAMHGTHVGIQQRPEAVRCNDWLSVMRSAQGEPRDALQQLAAAFLPHRLAHGALAPSLEACAQTRRVSERNLAAKARPWPLLRPQAAA